MKVAVKAGAEHRRVEITKMDWPAKVTGKPPRKEGRLGLGYVNSRQERLKTLINRRCRGVATKYLSNYLGWSRAMRREGHEGRKLLALSLTG